MSPHDPLRAVASAATEVLPHDAPRADWLEARRAGIGGSDVSTLLGFNEHGSQLELWLDKTGRYVDEVDNDAMEWGRRHERTIREYFSEKTGLTVTRAGLLRSIAHPLLQATPDGLLSDISLLEIKTASWRQESNWANGQVPDHAELQVQTQMAVTGLQHAWVIALIDGRKPLIREVERDDVLIEHIIDAAESWWADYIDTDEPPPLTGGEPENEAMRGWHASVDPGKVIPITAEITDIARQLQLAKGVVKDSEADVVFLDTKLRALIGDAEFVMPAPDKGEPISTDRDDAMLTAIGNGAFSAKRFAAAEPELAAEFTGERTVTGLDVQALKIAKPDAYDRFRARVLRTTKNFPKGA